MRTTIDKAGRIVVPKPLRDRLGITPGAELDIVEDGSGLRIDVAYSDAVVEVAGRPLIGAGPVLDDEMVRELRLADQR